MCSMLCGATVKWASDTTQRQCELMATIDSLNKRWPYNIKPLDHLGDHTAQSSQPQECLTHGQPHQYTVRCLLWHYRTGKMSGSFWFAFVYPINKDTKCNWIDYNTITTKRAIPFITLNKLFLFFVHLSMQLNDQLLWYIYSCLQIVHLNRCSWSYEQLMTLCTFQVFS